MRSHTKRTVTMVLLTAAFLISMSGSAAAHRNNESYLYFDVGDNDLRGTVQMPYPDVREVLGLRLTGPLADVRGEIEANLATLQRYAAERTSIGAEGVAWSIDFSGYELLVDEPVDPGGLGYVILPYIVELPEGGVPQVIEVSFTPFLEEIPDRNNLALIANYWEQGIIGQEAEELVVFSQGSPSGTIDLGNSSQWKNLRASLDLGVDHIRTGPDHIFFVFVLLLPSVLVLRNRRWAPAPSFRSSLWNVLKIATMFTLAHSITFTLAGLDLVPLPPAKLVEALIAASIAVAALHNLKPVLGHREWSIAFAFGLFHGLGFAAFVEDLEISRTTQLVSLLGRNLGIEVGQAVIILITFPALFFASRTRMYKPFFTVATLALATVSTIWVVERVFEVDAGVNSWVDKLVLWPRSLVLCAIATFAAAGLMLFEARRGRLVALAPVVGNDQESPVADRESVGV